MMRGLIAWMTTPTPLLMPYNVFAVWHPINTNRILKAYIAPVDKAEAAIPHRLTCKASKRNRPNEPQWSR